MRREQVMMWPGTVYVCKIYDKNYTEDNKFVAESIDKWNNPQCDMV